MSAETDIQFEVWQDGNLVAFSDDIPDAQHFMAVYGQDGPVEAKTAVTVRTPGFTVRTPAPEGEAWTARHIVFDGPPDHNGPRFIEVETPEGKSVNAGEWRQRPDNLWELVIASPVVPVGVSREVVENLRRQRQSHRKSIMTPDKLPADMEAVVSERLAEIDRSDAGSPCRQAYFSPAVIRALLKAYQEQRRALEPLRRPHWTDDEAIDDLDEDAVIDLTVTVGEFRRIRAALNQKGDER